MSKAKPLTRSEFNRACINGDIKIALGTLENRVFATIEAGGFAPEPIPQEEILAWLYEEPFLDRRFSRQDLEPALSAAANHGAALGIWTNKGGGYTIEHGRSYRVTTMSRAAYIIAVIAYWSAHPEVDVSHLLAPFEAQP